MICPFTSLVFSRETRPNKFKKMISNETTLKMLKYSDKILTIIDGKDEMTRGDLQGSIEAIVLMILNEKHN